MNNYIFLFLYSIPGLITIFGTYWESKKKNKPFFGLLPRKIIFIGGLASLAGGFWAGVNANADGVEIKNMVQRLDSLQTGSNGFCYIDIVPVHKQQTGVIYLVNSSKYTLQDIRIYQSLEGNTVFLPGERNKVFFVNSVIPTPHIVKNVFTQHELNQLRDPMLSNINLHVVPISTHHSNKLSIEYVTN